MICAVMVTVAVELEKDYFRFIDELYMAFPKPDSVTLEL